MHPKYHVCPTKNWCNDPNGFIYYNKKYHLFYQYFPYGTSWGTMHWYHVTSDDLITFKNEGIALYPSKYYDQNGCFSGTSLIKDGKLYMYYTSIRYTRPNPNNIHINISGDDFVASQSLLISDDGYTFDNINNKQLLIDVFKDDEVGDATHTRDPKVWKHNNKYYMLLVSKYYENNHGNGQLLFYESDDAVNWQYKNNYRKVKIGDMWECPDYFDVGNQEIVLLAPERTEKTGYPSHARIATCQLDYDNMDFDITSELRFLDYGLDLYAPQTTLDKNNNRVCIGWMRMEKAIDGFIGMMSYPRVITYKDNHIYTNIHPNIDNLFDNKTDSFNSQTPCKIETTLKNNDSINIGGYYIKYENNQVIINRSKVYIDNPAALTILSSPKTEKCNLKVFYDYNIMEVYINDGQYVISNIVYNLKDNLNCSTTYKIYTKK